MTKVCEKWFPKGSFPYQKDDGFYMDKILKEQLDILIKNIVNDWDFTIIITGGGEVRVGKSVLAMQIAAYWAYQMEEVHHKKVIFNIKDSFVFDGAKLIEKGNYLGQNCPLSPLLFDEAGADLEGRKTMLASTSDVLDYFRECGQYNLLNIIVMPEFFWLPIGLALSRSIFLIDVFYESNKDDIFERGFFNFYSRRQKKKLYLEGKKELNYKATEPDFRGVFDNVYTVNEKEYRKLKQEALSKRENKRRSKFQMQRDACWYLLAYDGLECPCGKVIKLTQEQLAQRMEQLTGIYTPHNTLSDGIRHFSMENE